MLDCAVVHSNATWASNSLKGHPFVCNLGLQSFNGTCVATVCNLGSLGLDSLRCSGSHSLRGYQWSLKDSGARVRTRIARGIIEPTSSSCQTSEPTLSTHHSSPNNNAPEKTARSALPWRGWLPSGRRPCHGSNTRWRSKRSPSAQRASLPTGRTSTRHRWSSATRRHTTWSGSWWRSAKSCAGKRSIKIILHSITPKNEEIWVGDIVFAEYLGKSFHQLHHVYLESFKKSRRACDEAPACRRPSHNSLISGWWL